MKDFPKNPERDRLGRWEQRQQKKEKKEKKKSFFALKTSTQNLQRGQYALFLDLRGDNFSDPGREGGGNCPP